MIDRYLSDVEASLRALRPLIAHEHLSVERPEGITLAYLTGQLTFLDGSQLAISEIVSPSIKAFRFHYMDRDHRLIYRWDSAPHHRHLKSFPFHLHTPGGTTESVPVNLPAVLRIIYDRLLRHLGTA